MLCRSSDGVTLNFLCKICCILWGFSKVANSWHGHNLVATLGLEANRPDAHSSPLSRPLLPLPHCPVDGPQACCMHFCTSKLSENPALRPFRTRKLCFCSRWEPPLPPLESCIAASTANGLPSKFLAFPRSANLCSLANCCWLLTYFADWATEWWRWWWPHFARLHPHGSLTAPPASAVDPRFLLPTGKPGGTTWNRRVFPATVVCCGLLQRQRATHIGAAAGRRWVVLGRAQLHNL